MIIKLTECRNNNGVEKENFDIWVNMDHFVTMNRSIKGRDTHMKLTGAYLFVKETPEEIMRMVEPPVMVALPDNMDHAYGKDAHIRYGAR